MIRNIGGTVRLTHIVSALTAGTAASVVLFGSAVDTQAAQVQNLTLNANVPQTCSIAVSAPTGTNAASFGGNSATFTTSPNSGTATLTFGVATLTEICNKKYSITISSTNGSTMKGTAGNTDLLPYSLVYDATGSNTTIAPTTGGTQAGTSLSKTTGAGVAKQVQVVLANSFVQADTYTDTLTLTQTVP
ncbi:MAG TPA: spore coat protein U domain-containing protein [Stellaceae bacterium]|nr:spore coat protein U domain-containing protein [Stellaceae bacterium]